MYFILLLFLIFLIIAVFFVLIAKLTCGRCSCQVCLVGKTALITGGNSGIGYEVALELASRGCRVLIADKDDATASRDRIINITHNPLVFTYHLNLESFSSIRRFVEEITTTVDRIDILINNAGIGSTQKLISADGLDTVLQVNHFGPFLLTHLLIDLLKKSSPSRVIFTSSVMVFVNNLTPNKLKQLRSTQSTLSSLIVYANSKLCSIISANGFAEKLKGSGITFNSLHPGGVYTPIFYKAYKNFGSSKLVFLWLYSNWFFFKNARDGAQTTIHLALCNNLKEVTGQYFWDCRQFYVPPVVKNKSFCREIWQISEELAQLQSHEKFEE